MKNMRVQHSLSVSTPTTKSNRSPSGYGKNDAGQREGEAYYTPQVLVDDLLKYLNLDKNIRILEPCVGSGSISKKLLSEGFKNIFTNDIATQDFFGNEVKSNYNHDACSQQLYDRFEADHGCKVDFVLTNPPFSLGASIAMAALKNSRVGVAFLVRLNFLEVTKGRHEILCGKYRPTDIIVTERVSFYEKKILTNAEKQAIREKQRTERREFNRQNKLNAASGLPLVVWKNKKKKPAKDSMTTVWVIWRHGVTEQKMVFLPKRIVPVSSDELKIK